VNGQNIEVNEEMLYRILARKVKSGCSTKNWGRGKKGELGKKKY